MANTYLSRARLQLQQFFIERQQALGFGDLPTIQTSIEGVQYCIDQWMCSPDRIWLPLNTITTSNISGAYQAATIYSLVQSMGHHSLAIDVKIMKEFLESVAPRYKLAGERQPLSIREISSDLESRTVS